MLFVILILTVGMSINTVEYGNCKGLNAYGEAHSSCTVEQVESLLKEKEELDRRDGFKTIYLKR